MSSELGRDPKLLNVALFGELDGASAPQFCAEVEAAMSRGAVDVLVDCRRLDFVDSRGVGALLDVKKSLEGRGGVLVLFAPSASFRRTLAITGLDRTLVVVDE